MSKERNCFVGALEYKRKRSLYLTIEALNGSLSLFLSPPPSCCFVLGRVYVFLQRGGPSKGAELCPGIMWSAHSRAAVCSRRVNLRSPGSIATTSTPITTIATPNCSHQSQPVPDSTCSCLPPFISEIRNGHATLQPSQRLSQIRPFSPFHNTRERKGKKNSTVLFYTFLLSLFPQ